VWRLRSAAARGRRPDRSRSRRRCSAGRARMDRSRYMKAKPGFDAGRVGDAACRPSSALRLVSSTNHGTILCALSAHQPCQKAPNTRHRMKIVKLEDFHADGGWDTYSFLKITTDEGVTGWSEFNESRRRGMTALLHGPGAPVIGAAPCAIARIDAALYARSRSTAGGLTSHAIAAIENACLDIRGKALGVPVYELLGGAVRERMPVYWSRCGVLRARCADLFDGKVVDRPAVRTLDDLKAAAREARERGFKALKTNVLLFDAKGGRQFA